MRLTSLPPSELSAAHCAAWGRLRAAAVGLDNPFFSLDFYAVLEEAREGITIAVVEDDHGPIVFLPLERRGRMATSAGSLISEIHGPIADGRSRWDPLQVVRRLGLQGWKFRCVPAVHASLASFCLCQRNFPAIDLTNGLASYFEQRKLAGSGQIDQVRRKARKFERDCGPLRFEWHTADGEALRLLIEWKSRQYRDTGTLNVLTVGWVETMLRRLCDRSGEQTRGILSALYWDRRIVAVHLGLQDNDVVSWWFPSYDREFARYSPGSVLLLRFIEAAAERGVRRVDLGQGSERYKRSFANSGFEVAEGAVDQRFARRALCHAWIRTREWAGASPVCAEPLRLFRAVRNRLITMTEDGA